MISFFICVSSNLWIKELLDRARRRLCIARCLELAEVQALSQMNDHWPNYSASALGKVCPCACVRVCVWSIICDGYKGVGHSQNSLVFIFRHTNARKHDYFHPHADAHNVATPTTWNRHNELHGFKISANLCLEIQTKQFLRSEINPHASLGPNMISPIWDTIFVALTTQTKPSVQAANLIHLFSTINFRATW